MTTYDLGDLVRLTAEFRDTAGQLQDPTTVAFRHQAPGGTAETLVYGTDTEVKRDNVGVFHVDVSADTEGAWKIRCESTGTGQAAAESKFFVKTSF